MRLHANEQLNSFVCETAIEGYYYIIYNNKSFVCAKKKTVQLFVRCSLTFPYSSEFVICGF